MKLDTKRTVLVGFAFLSICAFWQMYDNLIPLILTNTFHLNETISGAIMAADNVLALFLLPLFGGLSDKCKSRLGRRRPYILFGTLAAVALMLGLPLLADSYHTAPAPGKLAAFIGILGLLLVAMGTYRSPAVALMPDVTPKPLRSKANAVINLMGAIGGIAYLLITTFLYKTKSDTYITYFPLFAIVGGIMLAALLILILLVDEPKLARRQQEYEAAHPEENLADHDTVDEELPPPVRKSLSFLLVSIALWFIAYNGVTTWFSVYAQNTWNMSLGQANTCLTIATGGAILSYIPVGQPGGTAENHPFRHPAVGKRFPCRFPVHPAGGYLLPGPVSAVCTGGSGVGLHQRKQPAHGGGNVQGQRSRQVHGTVLHLLHGRPDRHPRGGRLAPAERQLPGAVSLRRRICFCVLCDHGHGAPR